MADLIPRVKELEAYLEALQLGDAVLMQSENPPTDPEPVDLGALKMQWRNQVIAGSSFKAAFYGTLTTEPTVTVSTLVNLSLEQNAAEAIIVRRDSIRTAMLALI